MLIFVYHATRSVLISFLSFHILVTWVAFFLVRLAKRLSILLFSKKFWFCWFCLFFFQTPLVILQKPYREGRVWAEWTVASYPSLYSNDHTPRMAQASTISHLLSFLLIVSTAIFKIFLIRWQVIQSLYHELWSETELPPGSNFLLAPICLSVPCSPQLRHKIK